MFLLLLASILAVETWQLADTGIFYTINRSLVVLTEDNEIFLLNPAEKHVLHYDAEGGKLAGFDRAGQGPGEFSYPKWPRLHW